MSEYTRAHYVNGPGFCLDFGPPPFIIRDCGKEWFLEWHHYAGPAVLHRRTHAVLDKQPGERSRFWLVAQWWYDQGGEVVDGVGVWKEPPIVEKRFFKTRRGLVQHEAGDCVLKFYKGYESMGTI